MCAEWAKGFEQKLIIDRLASRHGSLKGEEIERTLATAIRFSDEIPEGDRVALVRDATQRVVGSQPLTESSLLKSLRKVEKAYLAKQLSPHYFVTNWLVRCQRVHRSLGGGHVTAGANLKGNLFHSREQALTKAAKRLGLDVPRHAAVVKVRVVARTESSAADQAFRASDTLRGIWNFFFNQSVGGRMSFGLRKAVNRILPGPIHSLHNEDGVLATESVWYEPGFRSLRGASKISIKTFRIS